MPRPRRPRTAASFAVIDIGTNSVKLLVARCDGGSVQTEYFARDPTRIGRGVAARGTIAAGAARETAASVRRLAATARRGGADRIVAVGTHAFRVARNGRAVRDRIAREAGVPVRILSGREEAELAFLASRAALGRRRPATLLIDVGGGSVEFVAADGPRIVSARSAPLGAVRLTERYLKRDPIHPDEYRAMRAEIHGVASRLTAPHHRLATRADFVVSGGAATIALAMVRSGASRDSRLRLAELRALEAACLSRTIAARRRLPGLPPDRADIMPAALAVVIDFMECVRKRVARVGTGGIREGLILRMAGATQTARGGR